MTYPANETPLEAEQAQVASGSGIEDSYPITPMQQGMLFHTLLTPGAGLYVRQVVYTLREALDVASLKRAWEAVIRRHAILRTSLRWEQVAEPVQEVHREIRLPFEEADWRELPAAVREERLEDFLSAERLRGFPLTEPPLLRLTLVRMDDEDYRLVWTFHHVISDGTSDVMILREVFSFYDAFRRGDGLELAPAPSFRAHAEWLRGLDGDAARRFWTRVLEGYTVPGPLAGGASGSKDARAEHGVWEKSVVLSARLTRELQALAERHGLTLNVLMQGAWAVLLSRYTGQEDVVWGAARACRRSALGGAGASSVVGPFINIVPVRARVSPEKRIVDWLAELRRLWVEMRDYEHTPLSKIQEWCGLPPGAGLFESILSFDKQQMNTGLRAQAGAGRREMRTIQARTNYPLTLAGYGEKEFLLSLRYDVRSFDGPAAERLLEQLRRIFEGFVGLPEGRLADLSLASEEERRRVLVEWNAAEAPYPRGVCVHALVERQALRTPDAPAVSLQGRSLTYGELDRRSNQLAHYLRKRGVGPEVIVGVCLERTPEMVAALLAVWKAGGAYLPLDPAHPKQRLAFMLKDAAAPVLLTREGLADNFSGSAPDVVLLDRDWQRAGGEPDTHVLSEVGPENAAYVIYTSGSTGRPKGVVVEHRNLANLISWHLDAFGVSGEDRASHLAGLSFDASVWELWPYLTAGASVHLVDDETRLSPEALRDWLVGRRITICFVPTPLAEPLLTLEWPARPALRTLLTGGDKLHQYPPPALPFRLVNNYGPTENTVVTTSCAVEREARAGGVPPIGRPLPNVRVYILSRDLQPAPVGAPGEIYVGGDGLARCYLGRPALTAEKFVPDPFGRRPGGRLYRTGDLARHSAGGEVEFLGRLDEQFKVMGVRVEPGEVEAVLNRHPSARQAAVAVRGGGPGGKYLAAWVVPKEGGGTDAGELRDFLRNHLPEYMIPAAFAWVSQMPLTANGKIDREALPEPDTTAGGAAGAFVAPRTPVEESLAGVWREVLGVERVGVNDNFFQLRGNSLLAMRLVSRLRALFQVELPLHVVFEAPTIAQQAVRVAQARLGAAGGEQDEVMRLLEELEGLPDEAVKALLAGGN